MNGTEIHARKNGISKRTWVIIFGVAFFLSAALSMVVDGAIAAVQTNLPYYLFIPPLAWMAGTLVVYGLSKVIRHAIGFLRALAIVFGSGVFLQCLDPLGKALFSLFQSQAAYIYVSFYLFLALVIYSYALKRWGPFHWAAAVFLALATFAVIMLTGGLLTFLSLD